MSTQTLFQVETKLPPSKMRVYINPFVLLYCNDKAEEFGEPMDTTIYVVSTKKRNLVLSQFFRNVISLNLELNEQSKQAIILVVTSNYLQIISYFEENDEIYSYNTKGKIDSLFLSSFLLPFITIGVLEEDNSHTIMVWKVKDAENLIDEEHKVEKFEQFLDYTGSEILNIHAVFYVDGNYIVSCSPEEDPESPNYFARIMDRSGNLIRNINFGTSEIKAKETLFYPAGAKLFIEIITPLSDEGLLYVFNAKEILNKQMKTLRKAYI